MNRGRSLLILTVLAAWFGIVRFMTTRPERACNFVQNVEQQRVSWKGELPIHLSVHQSVPPEAHAAIKKAIEIYAQVLHRQVFAIDDWQAQGPGYPQKDGRSTIYWMTRWESDRAKEQARTTLFWNGNQINEADIRINAANFVFSYSDSQPARIDMVSLLVHEFGHVLGLTHDPTHGSIMNFSLNDGQLRRDLGTTDLASLQCEY